MGNKQSFIQKVRAMADKEIAKLEAEKKRYWEEWQMDGIISREKKYNEADEKIAEIENFLDPAPAKYVRELRKNNKELEDQIERYKSRMKTFEQDYLKSKDPDKKLIHDIMSIIDAYL